MKSEMINFKDYIAEQLYGKKLHFICDCIAHIDVTGIIVSHELINNEIIFLVDVNGKIIKIGENHPNMYIK